MEDTPLWSFAIDKLDGAIDIKWYIKDRKGARKRIYNKVDNTGTSIALHLVDMLVKHGQVNPYTDTHGRKMTGYRFSLALGKAFFLYTCKVFASKWAQEDFPCNGKQSVWTYKGTASDYK